jgi:hypothetical protein
MERIERRFVTVTVGRISEAQSADENAIWRNALRFSALRKEEFKA